MKRCGGCDTYKSFSEFHTCSNSKSDGYQSRCKDCKSEYQRKNSDKRKKWSKKYNLSEKGKINKLRWSKENIEKINKSKRKYILSEKGQKWLDGYKERNKGKINAYKSKYRANQIKATPSWLDEEDQWLIDEIYGLCALRSDLTGVPHQVDHRIPLQGKLVCGLHTPFNLQVLTAYENQTKSNTYVVN